MSDVPDIKIYKSLEDEIDTRIIPAGLPRPVFRILLVGPTGCGKTNIIKNICFNSNWGYKKFFNALYILSGSLEDVEDYQRYAILEKIDDKTQIIQEFDDADVEALIKQLEEVYTSNTLDKKDQTLIVFDDQMCNGVTKKTTFNSTDKLFSRGRHFGGSVIISTQKYNGINKNCRGNNPSQIFIFNGTNEDDLKNIAKEHCGKYNEKEFFNMIKSMIPNQFDFVVIDRKDGGKLKKWADLTNKRIKENKELKA